MTDAELIKRILAGEEDLFAEIVERYARYVWAICLSYVGNRSDCEDVVQDVFVRCYLRIGDVRDRSSFGPWLGQVARRQCMRWRRGKARHAAAVSRFEEEAQGEESAPLDTRLEQEELRLNARAMLESLPSKFREALLLYYTEGLTSAESAEFLGISHDAMRKRLERGRHLLREAYWTEFEPFLRQRRHNDTLRNKVLAAVPFGTASWLGKATAGSLLSSKLLSLGGFGLMAKKICVAICVVSLVTTFVYLFGDSEDGGLRTAPEEDVEGSISATMPHEHISESAPAETALIQQQDGDKISLDATGTKEAPQEPVAESPVSAASISGRIYDEDTGEGISGIKVAASIDSSSDAGITSEPTDAMGFYHIDDVPPGPYVVMRKVEGNSRYPRQSNEMDVKIRVEENERVENVDFRLRKGVHVAGRVLTEDGKPVAGAKIIATGDAYYARATGVSGVDGSFDIYVLRILKRIYLKPGGEGFAGVVQGPYDLPGEGLTDVIVTIHPGASIAGKVVDSSGYPVHEARIHARSIESLHAGQDIKNYYGNGTPDDRGNFVIKDLMPATYTLRIYHGRGRLTEIEDEEFPLQSGQRLDGVVLILRDIEEEQPVEDDTPGFSVTGFVKDRAGTPLDGVSVHAGGEREAKGGYGNAQTGREGYFEIPVRKQGPYAVTVRHDRYGKDSRHNILTDGPPEVFILSGLGTVKGRFLSAGSNELVRDFIVVLVKGHISGFKEFMRTRVLKSQHNIHDDEGRFEITDVEIGKATIGVYAVGFSPGILPVEVRPEGKDMPEHILHLKPGARIDGIVRNTSGEPVVRTDIYLSPMPIMDLNNLGDAIRTTETDEDGRFNSGTLLPLKTFVTAYHRDYLPKSLGISSRSLSGPVEITLERPGKLTGIVSVAGQTAPKASVYLDYGVRSARKPTASVGEDGSFEIQDLCPGEWTAYARVKVENDLRILTLPVVIDEGETTILDFEFQPALSALKGSVFIDEAPAGNAEVRVSIYGSWGTENRTRKFNDGVIEIQCLPAGPATVTIQTYSPDGDLLETVLEHEMTEGTTIIPDVHF
ncbi:sigma-70 family RNA polymerase sigma factor [Candidatus Hydrogenedentota bacterium]